MDNNSLIQQARELCEKATPGPWEVKVKGNTVESHQVMSPGNGPICSAISPKTKNAQFIAASRFLVPQLCDALEAAQKEIEQLTSMNQHNLNCYVSEHDRAEKAEAERDAANKCIHDTETYFDLGANKFAYRTIKQYTHDAAEPPKGE